MTEYQYRVVIAAPKPQTGGSDDDQGEGLSLPPEDLIEAQLKKGWVFLHGELLRDSEESGSSDSAAFIFRRKIQQTEKTRGPTGQKDQFNSADHDQAEHPDLLGASGNPEDFGSQDISLLLQRRDARLRKSG